MFMLFATYVAITCLLILLMHIYALWRDDSDDRLIDHHRSEYARGARCRARRVRVRRRAMRAVFDITFRDIFVTPRPRFERHADAYCCRF